MVDINAIHDINIIAGSGAAVKPQEKPEVVVKVSSGYVAPVVKEAGSGSVDVETVERIRSDIEEVLSSINVKLQLDVDSDSGTIVVKVIDPETQEVIKQIPSKEMLRVAKRVAKLLSSYNLDKKPTVSIFKDSEDTEV